jgi:hypothetical protein
LTFSKVFRLSSVVFRFWQWYPTFVRGSGRTFMKRAARWQPSFFVTLILLQILCPSAIFADQAGDDVSAEILEQGTSRSWFDPSKGEWVYPPASELTTSESILDERSKYVTQPKPPTDWSWLDWWDNFWSGSGGSWSAFGDFWRGFGDLFVLLMRALLVIAIIAIVAFLILAIINGSANPLSWRFRKTQSAAKKTVHDPAKIIDLPFAVDAATGDLLGQAEAYRRSGEYAQSIIYLFGHLLVELDSRNLIHLQRGKTNRMYLRELKSVPELAKYHYYFIQVFEAVFFGRYPIKQEQCDRCWNLLPTLNRALDAAINTQHESVEHVTAPIATDPNGPLRNSVGALLLVIVFSVSGCSNKSTLPTEAYGESSGKDERTELGGLGLFRSLCEEKGCRTFDQPSLTSRAYRLNWMIWTPKDYRMPNTKELQWFNDWLSSDKPRTLIFIGRDYSPSASYWYQAAASASPNDRATYRTRAAFAENLLETLRFESVDSVECDWFESAEAQEPSRIVDDFKGDWAKTIESDSNFVVLKNSLKPKSVAWKQTPIPLSKNGLVVSNKADPSNQVETIDHGRPKLEYLLKSKRGEPLVWRMRFNHWGESQVIVFSNASILANEGLTKPGNQKFVAKLLEDCQPKMRLGFLSKEGLVAVRQLGEPEEPEGFAMLRVWPLSLISMHGLVVGFIAILTLWPIFGRPQKIPAASTTDFGKHIEALGDLLYRSRDREYALNRVAEYFREVRRDTTGPWSEKIVDPPPPSPSPKVP